VENARQYTCSTYLANDGVDLAALTADEVRALIAAVTEHIETLTDQRFNPIIDTSRWFEGRGSRIVYEPQILPIVEVNSVAIDYARVDDRHGTGFSLDEANRPGIRNVLHAIGGTASLNATEFVVHERYIERLGANFPVGPLTIKVDGVFGWLEPCRAKAQTTSTEQLVSDATQLAVADSSGYKARDVAIIGDDLYVIITSVPDGTTIRFDSVGTLAATKAIGVTVKAWGSVPRSIQALASHMAQQFINEEQARLDGEGAVDPARIKKESVDRYMYELFSSADSAGGWVTGSLRHDLAVRRYSRPALAMMI